MRPVAPRTGAYEIMVAENQEEYQPLCIALYTRPGSPGDEPEILLTRWTMTPEERQRIANGEDLYISQMTFGKPLNPMQVQVGPEGWTLPSTENSDENSEPSEG